MIEVYRGVFSEAINIQNLLESNSIKVFILNEIMANVEPWVVTAAGFNPVILKVNEKNLEAATKIIQDFNNGSLSLDDK